MGTINYIRVCKKKTFMRVGIRCIRRQFQSRMIYSRTTFVISIPNSKTCTPVTLIYISYTTHVVHCNFRTPSTSFPRAAFHKYNLVQKAFLRVLFSTKKKKKTLDRLMNCAGIKENYLIPLVSSSQEQYSR